MDEARMTQPVSIVLNVKGMTCQGCADAVSRLIRRIDPGAVVRVELATGRVTATTSSAPETLAQVLSAGGYEAQTA